MSDRNSGDNQVGVIALVMAGGRAIRMERISEKPLVKIRGKIMVEWVIEALRGSKSVDEIVVAVSKFTPKTAEVMRNLSIRVVETPGEGYHSDVRYAVKKYALFFPVLTISADLPLITEELIDEIIAYYKQCGKPALTVAVLLETYEQLGMKPDYVFEAQGNRLVPVGINIIDGRHIDEPRMEEEIFVLRRADQVVNVNTVSDLEIAEKLLALKQSAIF